jgi:8-oxo-dGTP diphosphatase
MKQIIRRRGTAIVETSKGILLTGGRSIFLLPGGGADRGETRKHAAMRELREETGLLTLKRKYLFTYIEPRFRLDGKRRKIVNKHKVFLIKTKGHARPRHEIKKIAYWNPGSKLKLSYHTQKILEKYLEMKK